MTTYNPRLVQEHFRNQLMRQSHVINLRACITWNWASWLHNTVIQSPQDCLSIANIVFHLVNMVIAPMRSHFILIQYALAVFFIIVDERLVSGARQNRIGRRLSQCSPIRNFVTKPVQRSQRDEAGTDARTEPRLSMFHRRSGYSLWPHQICLGTTPHNIRFTHISKYIVK